MMKKINRIRIIKKMILIALLGMCISCNEGYLDKKPSKSLVVPVTLGDMEALLDNTGIMNSSMPAMGILGSDDYFMSAEGYAELTTTIERNGYTWQADIYEGTRSCSDWTAPYQQIFYSNVVLDGLMNVAVTAQNQKQWQTIKGRALFHRAFALFQLAQLFCVPYDNDSVNKPGLPLRYTSDVTTRTDRATVGETYTAILTDLLEAIGYLPETVPVRTQPSLAAGKAMIASVYLSMEEYEQAEKYASESLDLYSTLLNYNQLSTTSTRPVARLNAEVLFHAAALSYRFTTSALTFVDTVLYERYEANDLRKLILYRNRAVNRYTYKGNYTGTTTLFSGLSTNEVILIRAECRARNGNVSGAQQDINTLLAMRYITGMFTGIMEADRDKLVALILAERQKELVFRPSRWTDLRRLNKDQRYQKELKRERDNQLFTLPPNDQRYVYEIPPLELEYNPIEQNPR